MENSSSDPFTAALVHFPENAMNASRIPDVALASWSAPEQPAVPARLTVAFWDSPLSHGMNVFVGFILCFTMLGLGCTVEMSQIGEHVRRPIGVLLAAICQFAIMPLVAFLLALAFSLDDVAAVAVLLCGCCPGGNLSNLMTLLINGEMNLSVIMTISSTVLALLLMPVCLWLYSRAWIDTPVVQLLPLGAVTLTVCSTLIPIVLGVALRSRYPRAADTVLKFIPTVFSGVEVKGSVQDNWRSCTATLTQHRIFMDFEDRGFAMLEQVSLWLMLVTLVLLFIMTGVMLGPELLATIPPAVYVVAVLMPMAGYAAGYGLGVLFSLPPNSCRTVSLETGCQNIQLCTAILKLTFPPQLMGAMYMFPLLYALFQAAEAAVIILVYRAYRSEVLRKQEPNGEDDDDTNITYKRMKEEEDGPFDTAYGSVTVNDPNSIELETQGGAGSPTPL